MKIRECPNCRKELELVKETDAVKVYACSECGFEIVAGPCQALHVFPTEDLAREFSKKISGGV